VIPVPNRECKHPLRLFLSAHLVSLLLQYFSRSSSVQDEITAVKGVLQEEKELNAKRHEDLLAILTALTTKLSPPAP